MMNAEEIVRILRDEYGINSEAELDRKIQEMGGIDISPFCGPKHTKGGKQ